MASLGEDEEAEGEVEDEERLGAVAAEADDAMMVVEERVAWRRRGRSCRRLVVPMEAEISRKSPCRNSGDAMRSFLFFCLGF